jgi:hypothetical protein
MRRDAVLGLTMHNPIVLLMSQWYDRTEIPIFFILWPFKILYNM